MYRVTYRRKATDPMSIKLFDTIHEAKRFQRTMREKLYLASFQYWHHLENKWIG